MSEWTRPAQPIRCVVELDKPLTVRRERWLLAQGDANANAIMAEVYQTAGKPYDLTGCTVMLTFVRPDNLALPPIEAEISGNTAIATLKDACYEVSGVYVATVQLRKEGAERTILWLIGDVKGKDIDGIVDPDHEIISLEDLMATAVEAQKAASAANAAANRANAGADRVEQMQIDASGLAGDSNQLGGKPPEYYLSPRDLLDNSNFKIAQAGYNAAHGSVKYLCDRWISTVQSGTKLKNGVQFVNSGGGIVYQRVSGVAGKTLTFSMKTNGTGEQHMSVYTTDLSSNIQQIWGYTNSDGIVCGTVTIPDNIDVASFIMYPENGSIIEWAALYEGSYTAETLPPYVPKGYAEELLECRRYYRELIGLAVTPYNVGAVDRYYRIILDPPMRENVNPSVQLVDPIETPLNSWVATGATFAISGPTPNNFSVSASVNVSGSDFVLRIDAKVSSDL